MGGGKLCYSLRLEIELTKNVQKQPFWLSGSLFSGFVSTAINRPL
jgi:hypothetical protein